MRWLRWWQLGYDLSNEVAAAAKAQSVAEAAIRLGAAAVTQIKNNSLPATSLSECDYFIFSVFSYKTVPIAIHVISTMTKFWVHC